MSRCARVWLALVGSTALAHAGEGRIAWAELSLEGPLRGLVLRVGERDPLRFVGQLVAGEQRTLLVPVPVRESTATLTPEFSWEHDPTGEDQAQRGRARFVRWRAGAPDPALIEPALRARAAPPVGPSRTHAPPYALLVLAAGALAAAAARRRPVLALGAGAASGLLAAVLVGSAAPDLLARATVLEGTPAAESWLEVEAGYGQLEVDPARLERAWLVSVDPETAALEVEFDLAARAPVRLVSRGARILVLSPSAPPARWDGEHNTLADCEQVWTRNDGAWHARGPWPLGQALSEPVAGPGPPGWLSAGLPQGADVLVARLRAVGEPHYLRVVEAP